jgi:hypothetical protein
MHMSCIHKTSDGKHKKKGRRKPVAVKNAKAKAKVLLARLLAPKAH